jgi:hypothetical protein
MQRLYVFDATTTLIATGAMLLMYRRAEIYIYASAASSMFWSTRYLPKPERRFRLPEVEKIARIYRYSYGLLGTNALNTVGLALARGAVLRSSAPVMSSAVQFILDIFQKPMALLGSSAITAVLPEIRRKTIDSLVSTLVGVMTAAFMLLIAVVGILAVTPEAIVGKVGSLNFQTLSGCAIFIWANRYKSTVMDIPLIASIGDVRNLLVGGVLSCAAMLAISKSQMGLENTLIATTSAIVLGGCASLVVAYRSKLLKGINAAIMAAIPLMAITLVAICALLVR